MKTIYDSEKKIKDYSFYSGFLVGLLSGIGITLLICSLCLAIQ